MKKLLFISAMFFCFQSQSQVRYEIDSNFILKNIDTGGVYLRWYPDTVEAKIAIYQKSEFTPVLKIVSGYVILDRKISYLNKHKKPFPKHIGIYSFRSKYDDDAY